MYIHRVGFSLFPHGILWNIGRRNQAVASQLGSTLVVTGQWVTQVSTGHSPEMLQGTGHWKYRWTWGLLPQMARFIGKRIFWHWPMDFGVPNGQMMSDAPYRVFRTSWNISECFHARKHRICLSRSMVRTLRTGSENWRGSSKCCKSYIETGETLGGIHGDSSPVRWLPGQQQPLILKGLLTICIHLLSGVSNLLVCNNGLLITNPMITTIKVIIGYNWGGCWPGRVRWTAWGMSTVLVLAQSLCRFAVHCLIGSVWVCYGSFYIHNK